MTLRRVLWLTVIAALMAGCSGNDDTLTGGAEPIATEAWNVTVSGIDGSGAGGWDLFMSPDSSVVVSGLLTWDDSSLGATLTCPVTGGEATSTDTTFSLTGTGTATSPSMPNAPFNLDVEGSTHSGSGSGTFTMTFTGTGWPSSRTGNWTGARIDGSGITH